MSNKLINYILSPVYKAIVKKLNIDFITDDLIRLGKNNDGGYVVLKSSLNQYESLLSFGIGGDISFEKSFQQESNCFVNCFDPSIDTLPEPLRNSNFFQNGIDSKNHGNYVKLEKALQMSNMKIGSKIFMKMDVEGFEWEVLANTESFDLVKNFDQIVIELHIKYLLDKSKFWLPFVLVQRYFILKRLKKYFYFYNINANNVCGYIHFHSFIFPNVVEISMLNKKNHKGAMLNLNQPSDPNIPDIQKFNL